MSTPVTVPPAFERALGRFLGSLDVEEKKSFDRINTVDDVWTLIESLEEEQGARKSLRNMKRLEPFINALSQYAKVIEVFVQAKPEIGSLLWVCCKVSVPKRITGWTHTYILSRDP